MNDARQLAMPAVVTLHEDGSVSTGARPETDSQATEALDRAVKLLGVPEGVRLKAYETPHPYESAIVYWANGYSIALHSDRHPWGFSVARAIEGTIRDRASA